MYDVCHNIVLLVPSFVRGKISLIIAGHAVLRKQPCTALGLVFVDNKEPVLGLRYRLCVLPCGTYWIGLLDHEV